MNEPTQGTHVPQVAAISHLTRPFKKNSTYAHKNGAPNSSLHYGTIHLEHGTSTITPSTETETHKSKATN
jgi:hypothetical protein